MVTESDIQRTGNVPVEDFLAATDGISTGPLLAERDYVTRALDFANTTDIPRLHALQMILTAGIVIQEPVYFHALHEPGTKPLLAMHSQFIERLEVVIKDKKKARFDLATDIRRAGERIVIRPSYLVTPDKVEIHYRHYPADFQAALGYVLLLLLDARRPYGRDLCRCKIAECRKFFLAIKPPTGRPRRDYCSQAHLEASRALTGVQRVQAYRKRQRESGKRTTRKN